MIVYRLTKGKYKTDLSGRGASIAGGRWNSVGNEILYTSQNIALCTAEVAVHIPLGILPKNYYLLTIEIPDSKIQIIKVTDLPQQWRLFPHGLECKKIGDQFLKDNKHLILKTPSAVVQGEHNYLINPHHKDYHGVKIIKTEAFGFDQRLFG